MMKDVMTMSFKRNGGLLADTNYSIPYTSGPETKSERRVIGATCCHTSGVAPPVETIFLTSVAAATFETIQTWPDRLVLHNGERA